MNLFLCIHSHADREQHKAAVLDKPEIVRRIGNSLEHAVMIAESWVLRSGGTVISSGGVDFSAEVPADVLDELLAILRQFQETTESSLACGVGTELSEAQVALRVALKRGGDPAIVLYTPDVAAEAEESKEGSTDDPLFPEEEDSLEDGSLSKAMLPGSFGSDDLHQVKGEATKIVQGDVRPSAAQPSAPSPLSPPSPAEQDQQAPQGGEDRQLLQAVGQTLMEVKQQLPALEGLKQSNPKAYESILAMTQALIALAQKLSAPQGQAVQKSESEFDIGVKVESSEHPDLPLESIKKLVEDHLKEDPVYYSKENKVESDPTKDPDQGAALSKVRLPEQKPPPAHHHLKLPAGSVKDRSVKVVRADGTESWAQVASGQILSQTGHAISSRNPSGK